MSLIPEKTKIQFLYLMATLGVWLTGINAQEQKLELVVQTGHSFWIESVVWSPNGKIIASGSQDQTIKLWDVKTGQLLRTLKDTEGVLSVAFSPDGKILASGSVDKNIKFWNIETGQQIKSLEGHTDFVESVAFSPDGKILASGSRDDTIKLWDVGTGQQLKSLSSQTGSVVFSPDGKMLASISWGKNVKLWDVQTGQELRVLKGLTSRGPFVAFSPDGKILALGQDTTIKLWNLRTGKLLHTLRGHTSIVWSINFSPDGKALVSGSKDKTVRLWSAQTGQLLRTLKGHTDQIRSVAFSPNGKTLVSGGWDKSVKLWKVKEGKLLHSLSGHSDDLASINLSPDGKTLASTGIFNKTIKVWNLQTGQELRTISGHTDSVESVAFSPDGKILASGSWQMVKLWDLQTGREFRTIPVENEKVSSITFSHDGKTLALRNWDKTITLWDVQTGKKLRDLMSRSVNSVEPFGFSRDGKKLVSVSLDFCISLWDAQIGKEAYNLKGHTNYVNSVAFSPDGKFLASGSDDKTIKLWDLQTGQELRTLNGHTEGVFSIEFSLDGKTLASRGRDKTIRLWNVQNGAELKIFQEEDAKAPKDVFALVPDFYKKQFWDPISPNGKFQVKRGENGRINLFDVPSGKLLASLITFAKDDWLVITPEGLFDGTPDAWKQLLWRFDNNTFNYAPVEAFFKEFYYPGLLQEIMSGKVPKPPEKDLSQVDIRQPALKISEIDGKATDANPKTSANQATIKVKVEITDNADNGRKESFPASSGANDVRLFRNGSLVKLWEKNVFELTEKDGCQQIPSTKTSPRKAICETNIQVTVDKNELTAYAFNHDNVKSNDATAEIKGAESLKRKGKLQILAIGVNEYANNNYNLKFAVPDAVDFGLELQKQQIKLGNYETLSAIQLTDKEATKQNILYALEKFAKGEKANKPQNLSAEIEKKFSAIDKTQPEDVLIIYFAGHGTASKDRFYLIPNDGFPVNVTNEQSRLKLLQQQSISDLEIEAVLRELDAGQLLLIIDACNSGQALEGEEKRRGPMNSKGLAQLAFEKGMYILTAAQSYQAALEVSQTAEGKKIEHGLLTFFLLEGLTNEKADSDASKEITERELFSFAVAEVPRMQLEAMKKRHAEIKQTGRGSEIIYLVGDDPNQDPEKRKVQTPRVFYRRETLMKPLIMAKP